MRHIHLTLEFVSSLGEESWTCVLLHWLSSLAPSLPWGFVNFQALVALHWDSLLEENGHWEQQSTHYLGDKYSSKRCQGKCHRDTKSTPCRSSVCLAVQYCRQTRFQHTVLLDSPKPIWMFPGFHYPWCSALRFGKRQRSDDVIHM